MSRTFFFFIMLQTCEKLIAFWEKEWYTIKNIQWQVLKFKNYPCGRIEWTFYFPYVDITSKMIALVSYLVSFPICLRFPFPNPQQTMVHITTHLVFLNHYTHHSSQHFIYLGYDFVYILNISPFFPANIWVYRK